MQLPGQWRWNNGVRPPACLRQTFGLGRSTRSDLAPTVGFGFIEPVPLNRRWGQRLPSEDWPSDALPGFLQGRRNAARDARSMPAGAPHASQWGGERKSSVERRKVEERRPVRLRQISGLERSTRSDPATYSGFGLTEPVPLIWNRWLGLPSEDRASDALSGFRQGRRNTAHDARSAPDGAPHRKN